MPGLVVDASVAGGWFIGDEVSELADAALDFVVESGALVPGLWPYEIANMLVVAERRQRATTDEVSEALRFLGGLRLSVDSAHVPDVLPTLALLAREHRLTAYDASYLELAIRTRSVLATHDTALRRAAARAAVPLFTV